MTTDLVSLVGRARSGDGRAWEALIDRVRGVVWKATADTGLTVPDREDVFASTLSHLYEHLDGIREPGKLPGWVATTARNEVRVLLRTRWRAAPCLECDLDVLTVSDGIEEALLDGELRVAVLAATARLSPPCQELLRLSTSVPPLSYDRISELTGIPRGSLGPTRGRCLDVLRRSPELAPFLHHPAGGHRPARPVPLGPSPMPATGNGDDYQRAFSSARQ